MRNNIFHKLTRLVLFVLPLLLLWLKATTIILVAATKGPAPQCIDRERNALLDFKSYIDQDPYDLLSTLAVDEETTKDCCKWGGVTCNSRTGHVTSLDLSYGDLEGELPLSLENCTKLVVLELEDNKFSGHIPTWIGEKLSGLYTLSLASNNFFGTIPAQLCRMVHLRILDLSTNNLYGTIPLCLNNVTAMVHDVFIPFANMHRFIHEHMYLDHALIKWQGRAHEFNTIMGLLTYIDLSNNNLTGNIPYELTDLHELIALNLSMNALHGKIPSKIGQMEKLEILDLSRNKFSGGIPLSMSHMAALNYLDVSCNNLSGRIPSDTQLQSFEPSRYNGNAGLCGNPLTKSCPHDKEVEVLPLVDQSKGGDERTDDLCRWFYIGGATGFAIGFWIACGALLVSHWGRKAFFHFMDSLEDWVYVKVRVFIAKWQCIANA